MLGLFVDPSLGMIGHGFLDPMTRSHDSTLALILEHGLRSMPHWALVVVPLFFVLLLVGIQALVFKVTIIDPLRRTARNLENTAVAIGFAKDGKRFFGLPGVPEGGQEIHPTLYPFENHKRKGYRGVQYSISGDWRGFPAAVFAFRGGAEGEQRFFLVTMLHLPFALPPVEYLPVGFKRRWTNNRASIKTQDADFDARWRVISTNIEYAHAMTHRRMIRNLLKSNEAEIPITFDGPIVFSWCSILKGSRLDVRRALDVLADSVKQVSPQVVEQYSFAVDSSTPSPAAKIRRPKNLLAWLALVLSATFVGAPVGVFVGHAALRACKRGEATNHTIAFAGTVSGYGASALFLGVILPVLCVG